jgi:hypothetical protein
MAVSNGVPLVVFDFDKTIVDCDSDNWVVDALGATRRFDDLLRHLPWNHAIVSTRTLITLISRPRALCSFLPL